MLLTELFNLTEAGIKSQYLDKLKPLADQTGKTPGELFDWITAHDPSTNKKYTKWYLNQILRKQDPARLEDIEAGSDAIKKFEDMVRTNKIVGAERDINHYKSVRDLETRVRGEEQAEIKTSEDMKKRALSESEILSQDNIWFIVMPKTEFASQYWGKDSEWCIAWGSDFGRHPTRTCAFSYYTKYGPLMIALNKIDTSKSVAMHLGDMKLMDVADQEIDIDPYLKIPVFKTAIDKLKPYALEHPKMAYAFATKVLKSRWSEGEASIAKDPSSAYKYVIDKIGHRWPEAEPAIATNPTAAYGYAMDIIKGRWPAGESAIVKDPSIANHYASEVIKGRWPEAESGILKNPYAATTYAIKVLKRRWSEAEPEIQKFPHIWKRYIEAFPDAATEK